MNNTPENRAKQPIEEIRNPHFQPKPALTIGTIVVDELVKGVVETVKEIKATATEVFPGRGRNSGNKE